MTDLSPGEGAGAEAGEAAADEGSAAAESEVLREGEEAAESGVVRKGEAAESGVVREGEAATEAESAAAAGEVVSDGEEAAGVTDAPGSEEGAPEGRGDEAGPTAVMKPSATSMWTLWASVPPVQAYGAK
ncbi:hypothetical protein Aab01nite_73180 [Paractinoplanes abujensis]|nr:hypothetical protein Aab01nite_73180 [Actinoplanes abujensis]